MPFQASCYYSQGIATALADSLFIDSHCPTVLDLTFRSFLLKCVQKASLKCGPSGRPPMYSLHV